jgi:hypothetical protein
MSPKNATSVADSDVERQLLKCSALVMYKANLDLVWSEGIIAKIGPPVKSQLVHDLIIWLGSDVRCLAMSQVFELFIGQLAILTDHVLEDG